MITNIQHSNELIDSVLSSITKNLIICISKQMLFNNKFIAITTQQTPKPSNIRNKQNIQSKQKNNNKHLLLIKINSLLKAIEWTFSLNVSAFFNLISFFFGFLYNFTYYFRFVFFLFFCVHKQNINHHLFLRPVRFVQ